MERGIHSPPLSSIVRLPPSQFGHICIVLDSDAQILNLVSDHRNIANLTFTYEDESNVYFILELCKGGELFDRIVSEGWDIHSFSNLRSKGRLHGCGAPVFHP